MSFRDFTYTFKNGCAVCGDWKVKYPSISSDNTPKASARDKSGRQLLEGFLDNVVIWHSLVDSNENTRSSALIPDVGLRAYERQMQYADVFQWFRAGQRENTDQRIKWLASNHPYGSSWIVFHQMKSKPWISKASFPSRQEHRLMATKAPQMFELDLGQTAAQEVLPMPSSKKFCPRTHHQPPRTSCPCIPQTDFACESVSHEFKDWKGV